MYEDFLFHSKSVHFLHIYPAMWRSTEKTGFVLFSVTSVFFAIPTALENIQRKRKKMKNITSDTFQPDEIFNIS